MEHLKFEIKPQVTRTSSLLLSVILQVTRETHAYVGHIEEKEEGGTPAIIESIRAGMVFQLKREIGLDVITRREEDLCQ